MSIYATLIAVIAGICLGYALLYLFVGLRRGQDKRLNLLFVLFAFGYAGTLLLAIGYRSQTTVDAYVAFARVDTLFVVATWVGLIWFVGTYTRVETKVVDTDDGCMVLSNPATNTSYQTHSGGGETTLS